MKFLNLKPEIKSDRWIFKIAIGSGYAWLSIVFFVRKIFAYYHLDLFLLGILPNFFAGICIYLFLFLKTRSVIKAALLAFAMLAIPEIIQRFTPRTFDVLDLIASIVGIVCAELLRRLIERKFGDRMP